MKILTVIFQDLSQDLVPLIYDIPLPADLEGLGSFDQTIFGKDVFDTITELVHQKRLEEHNDTIDIEDISIQFAFLGEIPTYFDWR